MSKKNPTCVHCGKKPVRVVQFANPKAFVIGRLCEDCVTVVLKSDLPSPDKMQLLRVRELP
jgi:hypothetical protein